MQRFNVLYAAISILCFVCLSAFSRIVPERLKESFLMGGIVDLDTVVIRLDDCAGLGKVCLPLQLAQSIKLKITDNGNPIDVNIMNGCDFDTMSAYTYSTLFGQGNFGPYLLTSWPVGGVIYTDTFNTIPELVDSMNIWDPMGNWNHDQQHMLITGGNAGTMYDTMKVWVIQIQTPSFIGYNFGTTPRGTEMSFNKGFHTVILEDTINNMADTFYVHVACSETVHQNVQVDSTGKFCLDFSDLLTAPENISLCSPTGNTAQINLTDGDSCVTFTGLSSGTTQTCVVACDSTGFCDTTYLFVKVRGLGQLFEHYIEVPLGGVGSACLDTVNLNGPVSNVTFCQIDNDGFAEFLLVPESNCWTYVGTREGGADTLCAIACDAAGVCDTTLLIVKTRRFGPEWVYDTLYLNQSNTYCVDQYILNDSLVGLQDFVPANPLMLFYSLNQQQFCANYIGLVPGTDTLGLRLRDQGGNFDTTYLVVTILQPKATILYDTLNAGEVAVFCLDTTELAGTNFAIDNICKNSSGQNVAFDINDVTLCLEMQALAPGTDTACITICDNLGVCDTVTLIVTALDEVSVQQPPIANPDNGIADGAQPVQISVLTNDVPAPPITDFFVLPASGAFGPMHGTTNIDVVAGVVTYTAEQGFCNSTDNFLYVICNNTGCDTALVTVMVICDTTNQNKELIIYDGFSPNGDNVNDTFVIENIHRFPNHLLRIFTRWGTQVLIAEQYQNDWDGTWNNQPLPDGVYFYALNNGRGNILTGALTIKR